MTTLFPFSTSVGRDKLCISHWEVSYPMQVSWALDPAQFDMKLKVTPRQRNLVPPK